MLLLSLSALVLGVGMHAQAQTAIPPPMPITNVMVLLTAKSTVSRADVMKVMPEEVRETALLYLDGKIDHWYSRGDGRGVVFFLRCATVEEAKALMGSLPLDKAGYVDLEYIPVGPLAPLRLLTAKPGGPAAR